MPSQFKSKEQVIQQLLEAFIVKQRKDTKKGFQGLVGSRRKLLKFNTETSCLMKKGTD